MESGKDRLPSFALLIKRFLFNCKTNRFFFSPQGWFWIWDFGGLVWVGFFFYALEHKAKSGSWDLWNQSRACSAQYLSTRPPKAGGWNVVPHNMPISQGTVQSLRPVTAPSCLLSTVFSSVCFFSPKGTAIVTIESNMNTSNFVHWSPHIAVL